MDLERVHELCGEALDEVERAVVGKREPLELVLTGFLADGHVLLEDYPGLAKTLAARSFAQVLTMRFTRIQFTPDLMPSDVTGSSIWNQRESDFEFRPGPIFTNLLLADEINRAPPKTQAALLEAMQERQVTIEGHTHPLGPPFLVIATQNPIEYEGTYPLPEAQLDRFLLRTAFGYPARDDEVEVLGRRIERQVDEVELRPVVDRETLLDMQQAVERARGGEHPAVLRRHRRRHSGIPELGRRRQPPRQLGAPQACSLQGRARRSGLRAAGRREGDRRPRAGTPARPPARALGAADLRGGRRPGGAHRRPDAVGRGRRGGTVRRRGSPRLEGYAVVAAVALVAALALRRPELAIVAAPFALLLTLGTMVARDPGLEVDLSLERDRGLQGEEIEATIVARAGSSVDRLELRLELPEGMEAADGTETAVLRLVAGEPKTVSVRLRCATWGVYDVGEIDARVHDPVRVVLWEQGFDLRRPLKAYPRPESLSTILSPLETSAFTGSEVARSTGEGIEYADIRDYVPGDRVRAINWRASARKGALVVSERHPERNTDVVLFVDSFADLRSGGRSTLDDAVRAAAAIAALYLERRDRVGLVTFGGILRWLRPGMGVAQRYRLVETLLETDVAPTYTWRDVNVIPARILPPKSLVVALTPLVDFRFVTALENLRGRGFDLVVIEIDPLGLVVPGRGERDRLAYRLWLLEREVRRARLERLGVGIARWSDEVPLEAAIEGVRTYRRRARLTRV